MIGYVLGLGCLAVASVAFAACRTRRSRAALAEKDALVEREAGAGSAPSGRSGPRTALSWP